MNTIRVSKQFGNYNQRRYGKPWIGRITSWPVGGRADIEWGSYLGGDGGGEVEIMAEVGDVLRWGQKDHRGGHTEAAWGVVGTDGTATEVDAADARKAWDAKQAGTPEPPPSVDLSGIADDALVSEIKRRGLTI